MIIVGASFAGLAVAAQLKGYRVLVIDRQPIGAGQTSACGTPLSVLASLGLIEAVQQVHDNLVLHVGQRTDTYRFPRPYCTFDYALFCRLLWARNDAEFLQARALGCQGNTVETSRGFFSARLLVDASGWRAVLASALEPGLVCRGRLNFGLETTTSWQGEGLHFWHDLDGLALQGMGWAFPAGAESRIGVASYCGRTALGASLDRLLQRLGCQRGHIHGGYFPRSLGRPVVRHLFLVGDAAGHCLGFNGEGIRPALFFGFWLGRLLRQVLAGELDVERARRAYAQLVSRRRWGYAGMLVGQRLLMSLSPTGVNIWLWLMRHTGIGDLSLRRYVRAFTFPV